MNRITKLHKLIMVNIIIIIGLSGCSVKNNAAGTKIIEEFRKSASRYESARYFITNMENDTLEEVFTFYYTSDDKMVYLLEEVRDGVYTAEYNNGDEMYLTGEEGSNILKYGESGFESYSRKEPHPYAEGQLLFYVKDYIVSSSETVDENGNSIINYHYDSDRMNKKLGKSFTEFKTSYVFDKDGRFLYFTQQNSTVEDGEVFSYDYMIEIADANNISEIENPVIIT